MSLAVWLGEDRKCSAAVVGLDLFDVHQQDHRSGCLLKRLKDMTLLAGFQPLSIAKINILYHKPGFYGQIYYGVNFKSSPV